MSALPGTRPGAVFVSVVSGCLVVGVVLLSWGPHKWDEFWLTCSDFVWAFAIIAWIRSGGLWTECPLCATELDELERQRRARREVAKDFFRHQWGDGLLLRLLPPLYKSALPPWTEHGKNRCRQVFVFINRRAIRSFMFWFLPFCFLKVLLTLTALCLIWFASGKPSVPVIAATVGVMVFITWALLAGFLKLVRSIARDWVSRYLGGFFETLCGTCGYIVRGLPLPRCPECGTVFGDRRGRESS